MPTPSVAIVHDYLTQRGGAERVVLALPPLPPRTLRIVFGAFLAASGLRMLLS